MISEIIFENGEWTLELASFDLWGISNLDNLRLKSSYGTAEFMDGIDITNLECLLVTKDDLLYPLLINQYGDELVVQINISSVWYDLFDPLCFGDNSTTGVNAPLEGQSLVSVEIIYGDPVYPSFTYWLVKENNPSPGGNLYATNTSGVLCGSIYDKNMNPVDAQIKYCEDWLLGVTLDPMFSGTDGKFNRNLFAKNYCLEIFVDDVMVYDTNVTIEPEDSTHCLIALDTTLVGIPNLHLEQSLLTAYPNPFTSYTKIIAQIPEKLSSNNFNIEIFDLKGNPIKEYNLFDRYQDSGFYTIYWDGTNNGVAVSPGTYICRFRMDGIMISSKKLLLIR
jgi:hypothetical protein